MDVRAHTASAFFENTTGARMMFAAAIMCAALKFLCQLS